MITFVFPFNCLHFNNISMSLSVFVFLWDIYFLISNLYCCSFTKNSSRDFMIFVHSYSLVLFSFQIDTTKAKLKHKQFVHLKGLFLYSYLSKYYIQCLHGNVGYLPNYNVAYFLRDATRILHLEAFGVHQFQIKHGVVHNFIFAIVIVPMFIFFLLVVLFVVAVITLVVLLSSLSPSLHLPFLWTMQRLPHKDFGFLHVPLSSCWLHCRLAMNSPLLRLWNY